MRQTTRKRRLARGAVLAVLVVGGVVFYLWPTPRLPFEQLYAKVPPAIAESLRRFRERHPLQIVRVGRQEWQYLVAGRGDKTVLLLHGMTGAPDIWWQQIEALAGEYRFIAVTYPPVDTLEAMDEGVQAILQRENVREYAVVGSSLGGYFAQYLVQKHPTQVRGAVFANTFPPNDEIARETRALATLMSLMPEWVVMAFVRKNVEQVIAPTSGNDPLTRAFLTEMTCGRMSKRQFLARYRCILQKFPVEEARAPVLIVESANDPLVKAPLRERLKSVYPQARVHSFGDAGHFPYLNQPEAFTQVMRGFLRQVFVSR
jgi:pimeloyl-ACP methyl ester carboxylesterase